MQGKFKVFRYNVRNKTYVTNRVTQIKRRGIISIDGSSYSAYQTINQMQSRAQIYQTIKSRTYVLGYIQVMAMWSADIGTFREQIIR